MYHMTTFPKAAAVQSVAVTVAVEELCTTVKGTLGDLSAARQSSLVSAGCLQGPIWAM